MTESSTPLDRMSLQVFGCPDCQQPFQVDSSQAGQQVRCPGCSAVVEIPSALSAPPVTESIPAPTAPESQEAPQAFACPSCESAFGVLASMFGTTMACPHCGQAVAIEHAPPSPAADIDVQTNDQFSIKAPPKPTRAPPAPADDAAAIDLAPSIDVNPSAASAAPIEVAEAAEEVPVFVPQSVDHLLPPRFATLDPAFFYRRGTPQDQVLLPQADGSVQAVSNRIVTVVHNGQEYQLISSPRYRRNLDIVVNAILILIALLLMLAIWWAVA